MGSQGPAGQFQSYTGPTGADSRVLGPTGPTGVFATNYQGTIQATNLTATEYLNSKYGRFSDSISIDNVELWNGVSLLINNNFRCTYLGKCHEDGIRYQHLGTFKAPPGGVVLKLNYISCLGFHVHAAVSPQGAPTALAQVTDLCIYFYTSNANDYVTLPNGAKCRGYGWCTSTHSHNFPLDVCVTSGPFFGAADSTFAENYDFYVRTGPFVGNPFVTAQTSGIWTPSTTAIGSATGPANCLRLPIAALYNTMCTNFVGRPGGTGPA